VIQRWRTNLRMLRAWRNDPAGILSVKRAPHILFFHIPSEVLEELVDDLDALPGILRDAEDTIRRSKVRAV
jgi:hypothetical protein